MTNINWLHLTDLHQGLSSQEWMWPNLEERFFADLRLLCDKNGAIDLVLFTGDLVQKGDIKEYTKLNKTLGRVYEVLQELNSNPPLLAVPGNHDLRRPKPTSPEILVLSEWEKKPDVRKEFWENPKCAYRKLIAKAFENYSNWWMSHPFPKLSDIQTGCLPGDFAASFRKDDVIIGIVGLNSTFLQLTAGDFKERLALHPIQLSRACGEHFTDWLNEHQTSLLLTHQPSDWLIPADRIDFEGEIFPPGRFAIHAFGHMHENRSCSVGVGGAPPRQNWQTASLFGLEYFGDRQSRSHGYTFGRLQIDATGATMRLWPRTASRHQANYWQIGADNSFTLQEDLGTQAETIPVKKVTPALRPLKAGKLRVLVLATDTDLGDARLKTVQYLNTALCVEASEGSLVKEPNVKEFDLVILLQGWWWAGGKIAGLWQQAEERRRYALLVEDGADWPPRRLAERDKERDIASFRATIQGAKPFSAPSQLPELVGKIVSDEIIKVEKLGDDLAAGLKAWERSYLGFRIPAWLSGRTAGRPHILEPDATELYRPELYVPLNGSSARWKWTKGEPPKLVPEKTGRNDRIDSEKFDAKGPLARWVSEPELARVALVGAPGGGKTVFLTRIAAAFGNACLGRPSELEPSLNLNNLRSKAGTIPIPIVLEASRIAKHKLQGKNTLLQAIYDELTQAGNPPSMDQLEQALREGRYIIFVDALDEIADGTRRLKLVDILKGVCAEECYPKLRLIVTTRSARYTGTLSLGPELEVVEVASLQQDQVKTFCEHWTATNKKDRTYFADLMAAVGWLAEQIEKGGKDEAMTANPLMLTAICMVFERYNALPDDRARLCGLLVDDLCRSRNSEDTEHNWRFSDANKRDLLERIALAMQEDGAQSWPISRVTEIAMRAVPTTEKLRQMRATKHLHWAAEHTGLLRFQQPESGEEEVRFWHRFFREFLAASRLAQEDATVATLMKHLSDGKHLTDPFWEDTIRLLPRTLGTIEKAKSLAEQLRNLAKNNPKSRGRFFGLLMAGVIESRDLFPDVNFRNLAVDLGKLYEKQGYEWALRDRILFLEGLGNIDPIQGDPRLQRERWVSIPGGTVFVPKERGSTSKREKVESFQIGWAPVTVQEFREFLGSPDCLNEEFWISIAREQRYIGEFVNSYDWRRQLRHLNWPVTYVNYYAASAYCRWKTAHRRDGGVVRLTTRAEQLLLIRDANLSGRSLYQLAHKSFDEACGNFPKLGLGHCTPVGTFPTLKRTQVVDMLGNVLEWTLSRMEEAPRFDSKKQQGQRVVALAIWKGCWNRFFGEHPGSGLGWAPADLRQDWLGFRCSLHEPA